MICFVFHRATLFFKKQRAISMLMVLLAITLGTLAWITDRSVLRIEGTGFKNVESWGTDIRITDIYVNDKRLSKNNVKLHGHWEVKDGSFIAIETDNDTWLEISFSEADQVKINFWKQEGSGYIRIFKNASLAEELDLYSLAMDEEIYVLEPSKQVSLLQQLLPFLALAEGLALEYRLMHTFLQRRKRKIWESRIWCNFGHPLLLFWGAFILHFCAELIGGNLPLKLVAENTVLYFAVMLLVYIITASVSWSVGAVSIAWLLFAIINYYVTIFRGSPISAGDILVWQTAVNVAGNYRYTLTNDICYALIVFTFSFGIICSLEKLATAWRGKRKALLCVPVIMLGIVILKSNIYCKNMDLWNPKNNVANYGLGVNMVSSIHNMHVDAPADFSSEKATKILEPYELEDSGFHPNIIVVMNEAFSDLSVVDETLDSDLYMPYFNSLQENTIKGTAISSVYGGTTANSEYEFLTGNSMFFMRNHVPYQQHIFRDTYSLVGELKDRDYCAVAIHPYLASGYSRPRVYSCFGFDEFLTIDDFSDYELVRGMYISDRDSYKKVIEVFEEIQEAEAPAFIFNVTMQNHSTYQSGFFQNNVVRVPGHEGEFSDVEEYLTLVRESDAALSVLIDYFSEIDEPTIICLFGDHQPAIDIAYFEASFGKTQAEFASDESLKMLEVPFMIWANYDIEEDTEVYTSLNYLSALLFERTGVTCTPYQRYLLQLRQSFPIICQFGCMDYEGKIYSSSDGDIPEELKEYWGLEYHAIFDTAFQ